MNIEELVADIKARQEAVLQSVAPEAIQALVLTSLDNLVKDEAFVRKLSFGTPADSALVGSKFARHGLTAPDIEFAYDMVQAAYAGGQSKNPPSEELTNAFRAVSQAFYMDEAEVQRIDRRALDNMWPRVPKPFRRGMTKDAWIEDQMARAMDSQESGYGQQLMGAQYVRDIWEGSRKDSRIFGLLDQFEMSEATVYLPVEVDIPEMTYVAENTVNSPSAANEYGTVKTQTQRVSITAGKFVIAQMWSGELEEDSIIPIVPYLRRQVMLSLAHYSDSLVLNGDNTNAATGNINLDDADPADTKHYLAFDGIRHAALVDNTANRLDIAGAIDFSHFKTLRSYLLDRTYLMDWGHPTDPNDLVWLADPQTVDHISDLDEFKQMKIEANIPLLTGEVGRMLGHPLIPTIAMPLTEADGKPSTTANNNTKGQLVGFNRRGYKVGWRRRVKVESERLPFRDQSRFIYSLRLGLGRYTPTGAAGAQEHTAAGINITV